MVTETLPGTSGVVTGVDDLIERAAAYLPAEDLARIRDAYAFAARAHEGQRRKSGEPYVMHPLNAACIVADLRLDSDSIVATLLHDVVEDCGVKLDTLRERYGHDVAALVDGVTKLGRFADITRPEDAAEHQAENLRRMLVAMAQDLRVVLIKLADRLHNMRTLDALKLDRQRAIARETMEIYAPLAHRLGIWQLKWELEDLAFRYLEPEQYLQIGKLVDTQREAAERYIAQMTIILNEELAKAGIQAEVVGRPKHLYSVWKKKERYAAQGKDFAQIHDLLAIRVLVNTVQDCYSALGVIHGLWRPIPGEFDDYIAAPRESGYQSLHTTVVGVGAKPLEIQIRTHDMHYVAEYGVAAHWRYKEGGASDARFAEKFSWLRQLLEWQQEIQSAQSFVESVKMDLFQDQVFVLTPKGEIKDLPAGSTPLDFAYRIHTEVGHRCIGAKVNGKLVSLNHTLQNGDVVYILSSKTAKGPSLDWLNPNLGYIRSSNAREKVRQWFRKQERTENIQRGRESLEKERRRLGFKEDDAEIARIFRMEKVDDLYLALGTGEIGLPQIAAKLTAAHEESVARPVPVVASAPSDAHARGGIQVLGVGDLLNRIAQCCNPVPGDPIVGYITRSRGVTVHRADCPNLHHEPERLIEVSWGTARNQERYPVPVVVEGFDRVGLLRDITTVVSAERVNMTSVNVSTNKEGMAVIHLRLETGDLAQLSRVLARIEEVQGVVSVARLRESTPLSRVLPAAS